MVGFFKRNNWLEKWKEEFGGITSYSFMIYGPMTIRDQAILNHGLTMQIMKRGMNDLRFHNITEEIDAKLAELWGMQRGWNVQWVFPGEIDLPFIEEVITDGLTYLKLNHVFFGKLGGVAIVY